MTADFFRPLAGPYTPAERWMLDCVISDLRRGGIAHEIRTLPNGDREVWRSAAGWQEVIDIEAEEVAS